MEYMKAICKAGELYRIWVSGDGKVDLDRIHASIMQDLRWRRNKPQFAGVVREMRGHLVLLGKIRKAIVKDWGKEQ